MLDRVRAARPEVEIETVEVLANPARFFQDRVLMIPLIRVKRKRWYHAPRLEEILTILDQNEKGVDAPSQ